jgi:hypothetical protein
MRYRGGIAQPRYVLAVNEIVAIDTKDFPTKASRPPNSRLSLSCLESFGVQMPNWRDALALELDAYCENLTFHGFASQFSHFGLK